VKLPQVIGWVHDFEVYRDELIVAGWNLTPGKHILRWNGSAWDSLGSGTNDYVSALAVYRGDLIAGGSFDRAGTADAHKVARWDGTTWHALDASEFAAGFDGANRVEALIVHGDDLIVGGWFSAVGGTPTPRVARWDGTSWHSMGSGAPGGWVTGFAPFRGELMVGAHWGARAWDGSTWQAVDAGLGLDGPVLDFVEHEGKLVAAGAFTHASDWVPARNIASWNGSWTPIGLGFDNTVWAVDHYNDALVATGSFTQSGTEIVQHIAIWDGTTWRPLGSGLDGTGHALAVFEGSLVAGGNFSAAGGNVASHVARWDGTSWSALGDGLDNAVHALVVHEGSLFAGGDFSHGSNGFPELAHVARWDGIAWQPLGTGLDGNVHDLLSVKSTLVALGEFEFAGSTVASRAAAWDGNSWKDLGGGFDGTVMGGLEHLGRIYVTGSFQTAGGNPASSIAVWDGTSWSKLGSGLEQGGGGRSARCFREWPFRGRKLPSSRRQGITEHCALGPPRSGRHA
jgi:hypothetical protein